MQDDLRKPWRDVNSQARTHATVPTLIRTTHKWPATQFRHPHHLRGRGVGWWVVQNSSVSLWSSQPIPRLRGGDSRRVFPSSATEYVLRPWEYRGSASGRANMRRLATLSRKWLQSQG